MKFLKCKTSPVLVAALLGVVAFASIGLGAVITPPLGSFSLVNTNADGTVSIASNNLSFVLTGGNTGSGTPGNTDFSIVAQTAGTVQFNYSYSTLDDPTFDAAGYLLGTTRIQLADRDGISGSSTFNVLPGQIYGWYVSTADNTNEPGNFRVTVIPGVSSAPEPAGFALSLIGLAALVTIRSAGCRGRAAQGESR